MRVVSLVLVSNTNECQRGSCTVVVGDAVLTQFNFDLYDMNSVSCFVQRMDDNKGDIKAGTLIQCLLDCPGFQCTYSALATDDRAILLRPQSDCDGIYSFVVLDEMSDAAMLQLCERMLTTDLVKQSTRTFKPVDIESENGNAYGTFIQPSGSNTELRDGAVPPQQQRENSTEQQQAANQPLLMPVPTSRIPMEVNIVDDPTTCSDLSVRVDLNEFKQAIMSNIDDHVARIFELELRMAEMNKKLDAILVQAPHRRGPPTRAVNGDIASEITTA